LHDALPICEELQSTDKKVLSKYKHNPVIKKFLEWRTLHKLNKDFIKKSKELIQDKTGKVHTNLNPNGAVTGRFSCKNPNLQQIPKEGVRQIFHVDKDSLILG